MNEYMRADKCRRRQTYHQPKRGYAGRARSVVLFCDLKAPCRKYSSQGGDGVAKSAGMLRRQKVEVDEEVEVMGVSKSGACKKFASCCATRAQHDVSCSHPR